jgi:hypothetical protein
MKNLARVVGATVMMTAGLGLAGFGAAAGAQAQPDSSTGPANSKSAANGAPIHAGPTGANKAVPTTLATPFGGTIARQPGLAIAMANGNMVVPAGIPLGSATPMAQGNMVVPTTTITPLSGGIRTRRGHGGIASTASTGGTSPLGALGGLFR